jgi:hypothetical protein
MAELDAAPPVRVPPHVTYFGFWGSGLSGLADVIDATAGFTNLVHIREQAGTPALAAQLDRAAANGQAVILHVQNVFFPWLSSHLVADPEAAWAELRAATRAWDAVVIGYYLFDEPFWNDATTPDWQRAGAVALQASLERAAAIIAADRAEARVLLSYAHPEVTAALRLPAQVDWVAVNCYAAIGCSDEGTVQVLEALRGKLTGAQRLFLTPDAYWSAAPDAAAQTTVLDRIGLLSNYASAHTEVVALMPFLFQSVPAESLWGAPSMPRVLAWYRAFGETLLGVAAPTGACLPDGTTTVGCEAGDYVRRDSCGGEVERWSDAPPPYCPAPPACEPDGTTTVGCEAGDYVRRDSCGGEVERWPDAPPPYCG